MGRVRCVMVRSLRRIEGIEIGSCWVRVRVRKRRWYGFESGVAFGVFGHDGAFIDGRRVEASFTDLGRGLDQLQRLLLGLRRLQLVVEALLHHALGGLVFGSGSSFGLRVWGGAVY